MGNHLSGVTQLRCWNHTIRSVKLWLRNHGATSFEIPAYIDNLRDLLNKPSYALYEEELEVMKVKWSKAFIHVRD